MPGTGAGNPRVEGPPTAGEDLGFFKSTEQTGNGSEQSIAHTLAGIPRLVTVSISYLPALADIASSGVQLWQEGTHTTTAIKVTVLAGAKYKVTGIY